MIYIIHVYIRLEHVYDLVNILEIRSRRCSETIVKNYFDDYFLSPLPYSRRNETPSARMDAGQGDGYRDHQ